MNGKAVGLKPYRSFAESVPSDPPGARSGPAGDYGHRGDSMMSRGYVCHICGGSDHHIKNCPKGSSRKNLKRMKQATGLPRSWLRIISPDETQNYDEVYHLADGSFAILKDWASVSSATLFSRSVDQKATARYGGHGSGEALRCKSCQKLFSNPTIVNCCGWTFCRGCIEMRSATAGVLECPGCSTHVDPRDLMHNARVNEAVEAILSAGGEAQHSLVKEKKESTKRPRDGDTTQTDGDAKRTRA